MTKIVSVKLPEKLRKDKSEQPKECPGKITETIDEAADYKARDLLITARTKLLFKHPFFGNLAMRLKLVNADHRLETAATDGRNFYYNSHFVCGLKNLEEVVFLVAHEVMHVVYDHMSRREHRYKKIYNVACDYAINGDLVNHGIGQLITTVDALYEKEFVGKTSEEIYDILMENAEEIDFDSLCDQLLDEHEDITDPEEREKLRKEIREAIINAAGAEHSAGNLPAGIKRMIDSMVNPVMPWRDLINTVVGSTLKTNFSFAKPSRKSWHIDAHLPGMIPGEEIEVDVFLDLSGSISHNDAKIFISEVNGMMQMFDSYKINVACFDTEVYNPQTFTNDNSEDIRDYKLHGGGGTSFTCIFEYLRDQQRVPTKLIVFTDGYPCESDWGDPGGDYCDTVWIIHGHPNPDPPFGIYALYDDHKAST